MVCHVCGCVDGGSGAGVMLMNAACPLDEDLWAMDAGNPSPGAPTAIVCPRGGPAFQAGSWLCAKAFPWSCLQVTCWNTVGL
ncbi:jg14560 [Pararge aegeria aegeria]|uniref:Jg14560 protein n=1 Tax=Pararge aegeria aegeria TaxID=348720 RepID=A0A8S4RG51_9NEOP|nr:jg14560 [Pararge aegeria aegeria]